MPLTLMESEFFDKVMAVNRKAYDGYRIKDPPKEIGLNFRRLLIILIEAVSVSLVIYKMLSELF